MKLTRGFVAGLVLMEQKINKLTEKRLFNGVIIPKRSKVRTRGAAYVLSHV
jgi:hypothetical protein